MTTGSENLNTGLDNYPDLADIVAYFMRAVLREGVGVVDRTRGKARCACFAPESHMNMDMSGAQSHCAL